MSQHSIRTCKSLMLRRIQAMKVAIGYNDRTLISFSTSKVLIASVLAVVLLAGCSAATIAGYLPIFETAVNGVIALVASQYAADASKIETALNDLATAVTTTQSEPTISAKLGE